MNNPPVFFFTQNYSFSILVRTPSPRKKSGGQNGTCLPWTIKPLPSAAAQQRDQSIDPRRLPRVHRRPSKKPILKFTFSPRTSGSIELSLRWVRRGQNLVNPLPPDSHLDKPPLGGALAWSPFVSLAGERRPDAPTACRPVKSHITDSRDWHLGWGPSRRITFIGWRFSLGAGTNCQHQFESHVPDKTSREC